MHVRNQITGLISGYVTSVARHVKAFRVDEVASVTQRGYCVRTCQWCKHLSVTCTCICCCCKQSLSPVHLHIIGDNTCLSPVHVHTCCCCKQSLSPVHLHIIGDNICLLPVHIHTHWWHVTCTYKYVRTCACWWKCLSQEHIVSINNDCHMYMYILLV